MKTKILVLALLAVLVLSPSVYAQTAEDWIKKGDSLKFYGPKYDAIDCYDEALKIKPNDITILRKKHTCLTKSFRIKEAKECFIKILEIQRPDQSPYHTMAQIDVVIFNDREKILKNLKLAIEKDSTLKAVIAKDTTFKNYWDDPDFIELTK